MTVDKSIDLNFSLKNLDGKEIEGTNAGKVIANALAAGSKGDAVKYWGWALKLNEGIALDLDKSDKDHLKNFIKDNESLTVLLKGQVLEKFE
jgi:hypothetical protein